MRAGHHHYIPARVAFGLGCIVWLVLLGTVCCVAHGAEPVDYGTLPRVSYGLESPPTPNATAAPPAITSPAPVPPQPPAPTYHLIGGRLYQFPAGQSPAYHAPAYPFGAGTVCVPGGG